MSSAKTCLPCHLEKQLFGALPKHTSQGQRFNVSQALGSCTPVHLNSYQDPLSVLKSVTGSNHTVELEMKDYMSQHGRISKAFCSVKEAPYFVSLFLKLPRRGQAIDTTSRLVVARG